MTKQDQINMLQFRIERIESQLAEQHKGNNFNLSEKPNSCDHLLPEGYEFCTEEQAVKWVKVEFCGAKGEFPLGNTQRQNVFLGTWKPIRPIQYHVAVHEAVTAEPNPYAVDWSNAPEWADVHCFNKDGEGFWYGAIISQYYEKWMPNNMYSGFTLPTGLDWTKSKTTRPCK